MSEIRVSVTSELKNLIKTRSDGLGITGPEYLRMLINLDISLQRYQSLVTYINVLYNKINDLQGNLGVYATPIQEAPLIKLDSSS